MGLPPARPALDRPPLAAVRGSWIFALGLLLVLALPFGSSGQGLVPGVHAAYDAEGAAGDGAPGLGARVLVDPTGGALGFLATAEWFFGDASDYWALGVHAVWQVSLLPAGLEPYLGAGVGHLSFDDRELLAEHGNDTHFQLLAGTALPWPGFASPFVEMRYELRGGELDDAFVLGAGIAF